MGVGRRVREGLMGLGMGIDRVDCLCYKWER
jgi:hypothetical protein